MAKWEQYMTTFACVGCGKNRVTHRWLKCEECQGTEYIPGDDPGDAQQFVHKGKNNARNDSDVSNRETGIQQKRKRT